MASTLWLWLAVVGVLVLVTVLTMQAFDPIIGTYKKYIAWMERRLRAIYADISPQKFAVYHALAIVVAVAFTWWVMDSTLFAVFAAAIVIYAPFALLDQKVKARRAALEGQLDTALQSIAQTILVTQNLEDGFATLAQQFEPPLSQEADVLVKEARLGTPMDEAMNNMSNRCQSRSMDAIVTALSIGRQTGGDLPKILETTALVLRETRRVEGMMDSKTAEGKLQGVVLMCAPFLFGLVAYQVDPDLIRPLFRDPIGWAILSGACILTLTGGIWVQKISRIDV